MCYQKLRPTPLTGLSAGSPAPLHTRNTPGEIGHNTATGDGVVGGGGRVREQRQDAQYASPLPSIENARPYRTGEHVKKIVPRLQPRTRQDKDPFQAVGAVGSHSR